MMMYSSLEKTTILMMHVMIVHGLLTRVHLSTLAHMEDFSQPIKMGDFGTVKMGNCVTRKLVGIGDITFMTNIGHKLMLKEVRHVPNMCLNLIAVGKLNDVMLINHFSA